MNKLEIYIVLALMILGTNVGCVFYGIHWADQHNTTKQLVADEKALQEMAAAATRRAQVDNMAADAAEANRLRIQQGMDHVIAQFGKLPNTVLDAHGCSDLSPAFGMRWNATAGVPAGPVDDTATVQPSGVVPAVPVQAPK